MTDPVSTHRRPLVAITGRPTAEGKPWSSPGFGSPAVYTQAIERAGGIGAVLLPSPTSDDDAVADAEASARLAPFDGLVLTGGPDVDPTRYGQERHPSTYGVNPMVDGVEAALLRAALAMGLPTLAICRGLQVTNVVLGGTLHQHIEELGLACDHGRPTADAGSSLVAVTPGSLLAQALGTTEVRSVCYHHQAVDQLGRDLVVTARAPDGTVEGMELPDTRGWFVAVQWHPELAAVDDPVNQTLFDSFVAVCAAARVSRHS